MRQLDSDSKKRLKGMRGSCWRVRGLEGKKKTETEGKKREEGEKRREIGRRKRETGRNQRRIGAC